MFLSWKTNGETPPTPTLDGAIAFWSSKDPNEAYEWRHADICACAQYSRAIGDKSWLRRDRGNLKLWEYLNAAAFNEPRTFGALVDRINSGWRKTEQERCVLAP